MSDITRIAFRRRVGTGLYIGSDWSVYTTGLDEPTATVDLTVRRYSTFGTKDINHRCKKGQGIDVGESRVYVVDVDPEGQLVDLAVYAPRGLIVSRSNFGRPSHVMLQQAHDEMAKEGGS